MAEKMITLGKKNTLASRRAALAYITKESVVTKLFTEIAPSYENRNGGYTRILKLGTRRGDAAEMAIVALVKDEAVQQTVAAPAEAEAPVAAEATEEAKPATKKPAAKKSTATKKAADGEAAPAKKPAAKKTTAKKAADGEAAPAKKPAAKRTTKKTAEAPAEAEAPKAE